MEDLVWLVELVLALKPFDQVELDLLILETCLMSLVLQQN